jgi:hypothetical protein
MLERRSWAAQDFSLADKGLRTQARSPSASGAVTIRNKRRRLRGLQIDHNA